MPIAIVFTKCGHRSDSRPAAGGLVVTPGGTHYQDGVTKPLVARVAELEEKLVNSSMDNATAKQVGKIYICVWLCVEKKSQGISFWFCGK